MPGILQDVTVTRGDYWLNASWGVTGSLGSFVYKARDGTNPKTPKLYDAMKMIMGMSSMGLASIAISISSETRMEGGKMVPVEGQYELSVKIHNMFHIKKVPYNRPP
jgi:hypothetical protein